MGLKERRAREKDERKKQILDAARSQLFAEGIQATSINKIAKLAELGVGTIYFYFKSKEEIFAALQQEGIELLYGEIKGALEATGSSELRLRAIARVYLNFSRDKKDYFDIINYFLASPKVVFAPGLKEQIDQQGNKVISLVVETVNQGISDGVFKEVDPRWFALMFWAALHGLVQFKKLKTTILVGEDYHELLVYSVDYLIDGLKREG